MLLSGVIDPCVCPSPLQYVTLPFSILTAEREHEFKYHMDFHEVMDFLSRSVVLSKSKICIMLFWIIITKFLVNK